MVEEENNSSPTRNKAEMSPQEDGTKVPLATTDGVQVEEAKFKKGDTEIDVGIPKAFTGLTKEELMAYSTDPFWVRLRMGLFALFWLAWIAMLVLAIVIIIQAPACEPPPERLWVEEQVIVNVNPSNMPSGEVLKGEMESLGILSAYLPSLISLSNFLDPTYDASVLISSLTDGGKKVVTDLPSAMDVRNPYYDNATSEQLINSDGTWNYTNENLPSAMIGYMLDYWIEGGVTGFLMADAGGPMEEDKTKFQKEINELLKDKTAAVGSNIIDFDSVQRDFSASSFKTFLTENTGKWSYYKFNTEVPLASRMSQEDERLATLGLFMYSGTPMLTRYHSLSNSTSKLISSLSTLRSLQGLKVGEVNFANSSDQVVAFTRAYKGTPAYAIALNFNNDNETVSFAGTPHLNVESTLGTVEIDSRPDENIYETKEKYELTDLFLKPYQGMIIQFVGDF